MLNLWCNYVIEDWRIADLPIRNVVKQIYKREWSTGKWTNYITTKVDRTPLIKDYCFESPIFGQIAPESLSTGAIALIIMAHEPDTVMPMCWLGDNCIPVLVEMCKELTCTASFGGVYRTSMFDFDKIHIMETDDIIAGRELPDFLMRHKDLMAKTEEGLMVSDKVWGAINGTIRDLT